MVIHFAALAPLESMVRSPLLRHPLSLVLAASTFFAACSGDGADAGPEASAASVVATEQLGVPAPFDNPITPAKVELGRFLFWDPILSGNRDVSCASCHDPAHGYSDSRALSVGTGGHQTPRGALTVLDTAWNGWTAGRPRPDAANAPMFWDNRAHSLEEQARGPITAAGEMRGTKFDERSIFPELVTRLSDIPVYVDMFEAAFGTTSIDATSIVRAIATFERTLVTVPSYERWLAGDSNAISAAAKRGVEEFRDAGCSRCHSGPMLSDFELHAFTRGGEAIRTPSLRNVMRTAPYMHDGRASNLAEVFDIYRRIDGRADPLLRNLRVPGRGDRNDVEAFLQSASDGDFDQSVPDSVPSGLKVGGKRP